MLTKNYMEEFASLKNLTSKFKIKYRQDKKTNRPYLYLEDPRILVRFAGYLKKNIWSKTGTKVSFRGQIKDYGTMMPGLFRGNITHEQLKNRYLAYNELVTKLQNRFNDAQRFQTENVGAILQHYGIKTPWLDLVDNIYTAIWFATKMQEAKPIRYVDSDRKFGWIYFIRYGLDNGFALRGYDLREDQSSLSLRLHVQHGISVTREGDSWDLVNRCLNDFVVAVVKFPNNENWKLKGPLFEMDYMFPSTKYDNTYKRLLKENKNIKKLVYKITNKYDLLENDLGTIDEYLG